MRQSAPRALGRTSDLGGWIHRIRSFGGLVFVDIRDRYGITQIVFNPAAASEAHAGALELHNEYVIRVSGVVRVRPEGAENPNLKTGEIELEVQTLEVLNSARTPPFYINEPAEVDEKVRLKYRYLDLRREPMRDHLMLRYQIIRFIRNWLDTRDFVEVETPMLVNVTPGGAREFLVPSRVHPGEVYALPQSPQQFKQILMVAGFDRYFQIARCFRDEDLRADRQLEFTQLDVEMSFVDQEDILQLTESLMIDLVDHLGRFRIQERPFPRLTYAQAMDHYGTDKPDLRFGLEIVDIADLAAESQFPAFQAALAAGGQVRLVRGPGMGAYTRREVDELTALVKGYGARGLLTIAIDENGGIKSPLTKAATPEQLRAIVVRGGAENGDMLFVVAGPAEVVAESLGQLRLEIGRRNNLVDPELLAFCWVLEMPMFEWAEETNGAGHWQSKHHHFTSPMDEDLSLLESEPGKVRAKQYDIVCNGTELGGGSIRIHKRELQEKVFQLIGMSAQRAKLLFGHMLEAFEYGTPPHGGIAPGIDRLVMLLSGAENIRGVIAFSKTQSATDLMIGAPSPADPARLADFSLKFVPPPEPEAKK